MSWRETCSKQNESVPEEIGFCRESAASQKEVLGIDRRQKKEQSQNSTDPHFRSLSYSLVQTFCQLNCQPLDDLVSKWWIISLYQVQRTPLGSPWPLSYLGVGWLCRLFDCRFIDEQLSSCWDALSVQKLHLCICSVCEKYICTESWERVAVNNEFVQVTK